MAPNETHVRTSDPAPPLLSPVDALVAWPLAGRRQQKPRDRQQEKSDAHVGRVRQGAHEQRQMGNRLGDRTGCCHESPRRLSGPDGKSPR